MEKRYEAMARTLELVSRAVGTRSPPPFPAFRPEVEQWGDYIERFEQHTLCYGVADVSTRKSFFLSTVGPPTVNLLKKLFPDKEMSEVQWAEMKDELSKHFSQTPHVVAARYAFFQLRKKEGQTHAEWITDLVGRAKGCQFRCGEKECGASYAETLIRDMVILHTPVDEIRREAIRETDPSLEQVRKIAALHELTAETARQLTSTAMVTQVRSSSDQKASGEAKGRDRRHSSRDSGSSDSDQRSDTSRAGRRGRGSEGRVKSRAVAEKERNGRTWKSCRDCATRHAREDCRFRRVECFRCGKVGHIKEVCRSARKARAQRRETEEEMDVDAMHAVLDARGHNRLIVQIKLAGVQVQFLVESGAAATLINLDTYQKLGAPKCEKVGRRLSAYGKTPITTLGKIEVGATYKQKKARLEVIVVDRYDVTNILGLDSFGKLGFGVVDELNVIAEQEIHILEELEREFPEVFEDGLGECSTFQAHLD